MPNLSGFTNPVTVASLRLIIGALFLFSYYKFKNYKDNLSLNTYIIIFIIGLIGNFIPFLFISWSEQFIQSNTAGLLLSIAPIFALAFSHFLTKVRRKNSGSKNFIDFYTAAPLPIILCQYMN